tara:strand:+ start:720 stop:950 length:231 start_codon:yes stop_codon:yes gene_type:complete
MTKEFYGDSTVAFDNAIAQSQLSVDPENDWYAGRYMYMYSTQSDSNQVRDYFKNKNTRAYDVVGLRKGSPARPAPR